MEEQKKDVQQEVQEVEANEAHDVATEAEANEPVKEEKTKKEKAPKEPKAKMPTTKLIALIVAGVVAAVLVATLIFAIVSTAKASKNQKAINDLNSKLNQLTEQQQDESEVEKPAADKEAMEIIGAVVKDDCYYLEVPNSQDKVDLSKIVKSNGAWIASIKADGSSPIDASNFALSKGENTIYLVSKGAEKNNIYKLVIDRTESYQISYYLDEEPTYNITFKHDASSWGFDVINPEVLATQTVHSGQELVYPIPVGSSDNYIFTGWYYYDVASDSYVFFDPSKEITSNIALEASWTNENHSFDMNYTGNDIITVDFDLHSNYYFYFTALTDGEITVTCNAGVEICLENYSFDLIEKFGFGTCSISAKAGDVIEIEVYRSGPLGIVTGTQVLTIHGATLPQFKEVEYNPDKVELVKFGDNYTSYKPVKDGYKFAGWYNGSEKVNLDGEFSYSSDLSLTAKWEVETYKLSAYIDDIQLPELYISTYTVEDYEYKMWMIQQLGSMYASELGISYKYPKHWYTDAALTNEIDLEELHTGDLTLYSTFESMKYKIYLDLGQLYRDDVDVDLDCKINVTLDYNYPGRPEPKTYTATHETAIPYEIPTREGYTFKGWYRYNSGYSFVNVDETFYEDSYFYALWEPDYDSIYEITGPMNIKFTPQMFEERYYRFVSLKDQDIVITANDLLSGHYYSEDYSDEIPMMFAGDKYRISVNAGDVIYFTFSSGELSLNVDLDISFVDIYDPEDYVLNWKAAECVFTIPVYYGEEYSIPAITGDHRFVSEWNDNGYDFVTYPQYNYKMDKYLEAGWYTTPYKITYVLNGGEFDSPSVDEYYEDDTVYLPNAVKEGYYFDGWAFTQNPDMDDVFGTIYPYTTYSDITLYAQWVEKDDYRYVYYDLENLPEGALAAKYNIKWELNGGHSDVYVDGEYTAYDLANLTEMPTREGYSFITWCSDPECEETAYFYPSGDRNLTFYALWEPVPEGINVDYNYGIGQGPITIESKNESMFDLNYVTICVPVYPYTTYLLDIDTSSTVQILVRDSEHYVLYTQIKEGSHSPYYSSDIYWESGDSTKELTFENYDYLPVYLYIRCQSSGEFTFDLRYKYGGSYNEMYDIYRESNGYKLPFTAEELAAPGYKLVDIYDDESNHYELGTTYSETGNYFTFVYEIVDYTITYHLPEHATNDVYNPYVYTITDDYEIWPAELSGYEFVGWFDNPDLSGDPIEFTLGLHANLDLYPKFEKLPEYLIYTDPNAYFKDVKYTIHFDLNGVEGEPVPDQVVTPYVESKYVIPSAEGYIFTGWYDDPYCNFEHNFNNLYYWDTTLYAGWMPFDAKEGYKYIQLGPDYEMLEVNINKDEKVRYIYYAFHDCNSNFEVHPYLNLVHYFENSEYNYGCYDSFYLDAGDYYEFELIPYHNNYSDLFTKGLYLYHSSDFSFIDGSKDTGIAYPYELYVEFKEGDKYYIPNMDYPGYELDEMIDINISSVVDDTMDIETGYNHEITINWKLIEYTIKFDTSAYSGVAPIADMKYDITSAFTLPTPTLSGYTFRGWYLDSNLRLGPVDAENILYELKDVTLYAKFDEDFYYAEFYNPHGTFERAYTVTFDLNGAPGTNPATQIVTNENPIVAPVIPNYPGYAFLGWYFEDHGVNHEFWFDYEVCQDYDLFALWEEQYEEEHYIYLTLNYNTPVEFTFTKMTYSLEAYAVLPVTTRYDLTCEGMYIYADLYDEVGNYYTTCGGENHISFDGVGNGSVEIGIYTNDSFDYEGNYLKPHTMILTAESLEGGYSSPDCLYLKVKEGEDISSKLPTKFNLNPGFKLYDDEITWVDSSDNIFTGVYNYDYSEGFSLVCTPINYTITYVMPEGATTSSATSYNAYSGTVTLKNCILDGYVFRGWYDNKDFEGQEINYIKNEYCDKTFYAKTEKIKYDVLVDIGTGEFAPTPGEDTSTVYFSLNGMIETESIPPQECSLSNPLVLPEEPSAYGFVFGGWFLDRECTEPYIGQMYFEEDTILYACWIEIADYVNTSLGTIGSTTRNLAYLENNRPSRYKGSLEFVDRSEVEDTKLTNDYFFAQGYGVYYFTFAAQPNVKEENGYKYARIHFDSSKVKVYIYKISNYSYGLVKTGEVTNGQQIAMSPGYAYYVVVYVNSSSSKSSYVFADVDYANYLEYTVEYGDEFSLPQISKEGYTLTWKKFSTSTYTYKDFTTTSPFTWDITDGSKFRAEFALNTYTIDYDLPLDATNSPSNPLSYNINSGLITLDDPTRPGYTFLGWYDNEMGNGDPITTIDPTELKDMLLYAKFDINTYNITYSLDEGVENGHNNPSTYTINDVGFEFENPTRPGYVFDGWYDNAEFSGSKVTEIESTWESDIELFAKWNIITYTITFHIDDEYTTLTGTSTSTYKVTYGLITLNKPSVATGYVFDGWYTNSSYSGDSIEVLNSTKCENIELYGRVVPES